jgi:hypothetical protein
MKDKILGSYMYAKNWIFHPNNISQFCFSKSNHAVCKIGLIMAIWTLSFLSSTTSLWLSDIDNLLLNSGHWDLEFLELNNQPLAIRHCSFAS